MVKTEQRARAEEGRNATCYEAIMPISLCAEGSRPPPGKERTREIDRGWRQSTP